MNDPGDAWDVIAGASLGDMLAAAQYARDQPAMRRTDPETGYSYSCVGVTIDDRLVAALYVASRYDADGQIVVARQTGPNVAVAVYAAEARIAPEDE